jgi:hypothetical protein
MEIQILNNQIHNIKDFHDEISLKYDFFVVVEMFNFLINTFSFEKM